MIFQYFYAPNYNHWPFHGITALQIFSSAVLFLPTDKSDRTFSTVLHFSLSSHFSYELVYVLSTEHMFLSNWRNIDIFSGHNLALFFSNHAYLQQDFRICPPLVTLHNGMNLIKLCPLK